MQQFNLNREKLNQFFLEAGRIARGSASSKAGVSRAFRPTSAQALMEFVLVSIPLMITMVGLFEFGLAYYDNTKLDSTTRELSRRLSICSNSCDIYTNGSTSLTADGSTVPWDVAALQIVNASGYNNPAALDPANVVYIHLQRVGLDGEITSTISTTNYVNSNNQWIDANTANGTDGVKLGYRPFYVHYITSTAATAVAPYKVATPADGSRYYNPPNLSSTDVPAQYRGWPSRGFTSGSYYMWGRNICEPTDHFYVEIQYNHKWVTPMGSLTGLSGSIPLTRRVYSKIEARFFSGGAQLLGTCV